MKSEGVRTFIMTQVSVRPTSMWLYGQDTEEVQDRDIKHLDIPDKVCSFRFFDAASATTREITNMSPTYFYGGRVMTVGDVEKEMPDKKFLIDNMKSQKVEKCVKDWNGIFHTFKKDDLYVDPKTREIKTFADFPTSRNTITMK